MRASSTSRYEFFFIRRLFIGITFEIEFHDCVVLCDLTNFDRIKKVHLNSFSLLEVAGNIFYPFIVYWVFCPLFHTRSLCHHVTFAFNNPSIAPRCQHIFLFTWNSFGVFILLVLFFRRFFLSAAHHRTGMRLFPINYKICQISIKLRLWPTFREIYLIKKTLNWEIWDFAMVLFVCTSTRSPDLIDWR